MNAPTHPQDEQLAAMAGGDPEVAADVALRAHVGACDRCGPMVRELGALRMALAQLPDLAPSRPIQLVPPAAEPKARGALGWLRALAAPAMVAGAGMILAGAVGIYGSGFGAATGAAPELFTDMAGEVSAESAGGVPADRVTVSPESDNELTPQTGRDSVDGEDEESVALLNVDPPNWWLVLVVTGAGLLVLGLVFRFSIRPRAG